jgi:hypothetical protein
MRSILAQPASTMLEFIEALNIPKDESIHRLSDDKSSSSKLLIKKIGRYLQTVLAASKDKEIIIS